LKTVAALIAGTRVEIFPLTEGTVTEGSVKELIAAGQDAGLIDWPAAASLMQHKDEWLAAIERAIARIREILDRCRSHDD
jgi:hypothetical protein